jgi:hypothetical protein
MIILRQRSSWSASQWSSLALGLDIIANRANWLMIRLSSDGGSKKTTNASG